jgi:GNAT superfamily N-acetyltransferase
VTGQPLIRPAESGDEVRLREIAAAAKGHWGYDRERLEAWAGSLDLSDLSHTWVGIVDAAVVGWVAIVPGPSVCILDHLWVDPPSIGRSIGTELFRVAATRSRELGANWLQWESEPNATGFYEKLGAVQIGETLGSWGRELPVMQYDLGG